MRAILSEQTLIR